MISATPNLWWPRVARTVRRGYLRAMTLRMAAAALVLLLHATGLAHLVAGPPLAAQTELSDAPVDGVDYRAYHGDGRPAAWADVVSAGLRADVLLVGEEHDDRVGHWYEAELLARMADEGTRPIVLSLEMFERDVQYVLDEYLAGLITEEHFLSSARPWEGYGDRHRPLVEAAKARGLPVVAANAPRRYVNRVTREGPRSLAALSERARGYLPPLPYPGPSERYRAQWDTLIAASMHASDAVGAERGYAMNSNAIHAQALWDASMGHAIATALMVHRDAIVVHVAGSFHVERGTGIPERIADYRPGSRVVAVVIAKVDEIGAWSEAEHSGLGDFVVVTRRPRTPG